MAVELSDEAREACARAAKQLEPRLANASWTPAENMHCTVKFLGAVADDRVTAVVEAVHAAVATAPPIDTALTALGAFPDVRRARVVWVGLDGEDALGAIASSVDDVLVPLGFEPESRRFRAHVTIARLRAPAPVVLGVEVEPVRFRVGHVTIFRSHLGQGPGRSSRYEAIARAPLSERP